MNTCGIKIGDDCRNLIMDFVYQLEHVEKYKSVMVNIKKICHYNRFNGYQVESRRYTIDMKYYVTYSYDYKDGLLNVDNFYGKKNTFKIQGTFCIKI